jgi:ankyrin repeat protein
MPKSIFSGKTIRPGRFSLFFSAALGLALFLSFLESFPASAEDIAVIKDPLGYPFEEEDSYFSYNPFQRGKKYKDIKKIDRYVDSVYTPLILAVIDKDAEEVNKLLNQGANPNVAGGNGLTAVYQAMASDQFEILTLLLKRGAIPNDDAMYLASGAKKNDPKYLELLGRYYRPPKPEKPDPNLKGKSTKRVGVATLEEAYELKNIIEWENKNKKRHPSVTAAVMLDRPKEVLEKLFEEGSSFNEDDPILGTPLSQAIVQKRNLEYIELLLKGLASPNTVSKANKRWPLLQAVQENNLALVKLLFDYKAKIWVPEAEGMDPPFFYALRSNNIEMIKLLIENGADPAKKLKRSTGEETWPFLLAVSAGTLDPELIKLLIASGADPKVKDKEACNAFALLDWTKQNLPAALYLLELGVSPKDPCVFEKHKQSPYHYAVREDSKELLIALAKTKLSPNVFDKDDSSPLYLAVIFDKPFFVKALIDAGANVNKSVAAPGVIFADSRGIRKAAEDLLAEAIIHTDNPEIIEILLDAGVKINVVTNSPDRLTALHVAVEENKPELAELILKRKSGNKDAQNIYGQTPLHLAVHAQDTKFVKLLAAAGAKITVKDNQGLTPVDHARGEKKEKELLEAMGL